LCKHVVERDYIINWDKIKIIKTENKCEKASTSHASCGRLYDKSKISVRKCIKP